MPRRPGLLSNGIFVDTSSVALHFSHLLLYVVDCLRVQPVVQIMEVWRDGLWAILIVLKRHAKYSTFVDSNGNSGAGDIMYYDSS